MSASLPLLPSRLNAIIKLIECKYMINPAYFDYLF
jgi:hypothetical protein